MILQGRTCVFFAVLKDFFDLLGILKRGREGGLRPFGVFPEIHPFGADRRPLWKPGITKTDEFSENCQTALDPPSPLQCSVPKYKKMNFFCPA